MSDWEEVISFSLESSFSWTWKCCLAACCSQEPTAGMNHLLPDTSVQTQTTRGAAGLRPRAESSASAAHRDPNPELFAELHAESLLVAGTKAAGREPGRGGGGGGGIALFSSCTESCQGWCGNGAAAASTKAPFISAATLRGPLPSHGPPLPRSSSATVLGLGSEKAPWKRSSWQLLGWDVARLVPGPPAGPGSAWHRVGAGGAFPSCRCLLHPLPPSVVSWGGGKSAPSCTTELGKERCCSSPPPHPCFPGRGALSCCCWKKCWSSQAINNCFHHLPEGLCCRSDPSLVLPWVACPGTSSTRAWQPPCLSLPSTCGRGSLSSAANPDRGALPLLDWLWVGRGGCSSPFPAEPEPTWCVSNPCPAAGICPVLRLPPRWLWGLLGSPGLLC
ncbi:stAR-related lipid transfer protein 3 isoform X2 [Excalfactoria chinensis]|uniref:stAR-related lipid transfer protein 3 isoform X2 n=1 Tax=Excalfactoria chinensis TaxID=46218 RepID=UPI003B3AD02E